jgi:long-chain fatty acid transport protein
MHRHPISRRHVPGLAVVGTLALMLGHAGPASAGAFGLNSFAASATGQSNAGAASGSGGIGSMFWNPATVTMAPGANLQVNATVIDLSSRIVPGAGTSPFLGNAGSGELGLAAFVPSGFASYQVTDRVWLGLSTTVPFGATTKPDADWSGAIYSRTSRVRSYSINPIVGIRVTDWLSIGAGPNIEIMQVRLNKASSFLPGAPTAFVRGDDVAVGFTLGALLTPAEGTVIGIGFRSSVSHDLRGKLGTGSFTLPIKARLDTPEQLTVGLTQTLSPGLRLNLGYEWTNWSRLRTVDYVGPTGQAVSSLPLDYRDGHLFSVGAEYDVDRSWTVRGGLGYEISPVTQANRSTAIPDSNRFLVSVGVSYRLNDRLSFDFGYQRLFAEDAKVRIGAGSRQLVTANLPGLGATPLDFAGDVRSSANVFTVAARYRFD